MNKQIVRDEKTGVRYEVVDLLHVFDKEDDLSFHDTAIGVAEWSIEGYFEALWYEGDEEYKALPDDDEVIETWLDRKEWYFNDLLNKGEYMRVIEETYCRACKYELIGSELKEIDDE